ncbi:MAG: CPBP family glutamic-type intramembrane protease [Chloroflexota bacterium]
MFGAFDPLAHLFVGYLALIHPWLGWRSYRRLRAGLAAKPALRASYYRRMLLQEWFWVLLVALILGGGEGARRVLGLRPPTALGWLIVGAVVLATAISALLLNRLPNARLRLQAQWRRAGALLPATPGERWLFAAVALSAGICEEIVFRGYLWYYFALLLNGQSAWLSPALACLIFGLVHAYQGRLVVLQTTLVGVLMFVLYWLSGSLLPAILLHVVIDMRPLVVWTPARPVAVVEG